MKNRRDFLKVTAAGSMGLLVSNPLASIAGQINHKNHVVGLQLYTIRDAVSADLKGSLQKVADLGYKTVELAGYADGKFYGQQPKEFKKMVNGLGMDIISSHTQVEAAGITMDNAKIMADAHAEMGVKYCIQPWVNEEDRNIETYKKMIGEWNKVGGIMKKVGIQFGYHNHNFEFENINGIVPYYDLFMKEMDADLITMEIDFFWVSKAGQDPVEMFKKYPGRFKLFHMKDMKTNQEPFYNVFKEDVCSVGEGVIDFKRIMAAKEIAGMEYLFVEDDNQGNGKPFKSIGASIKNLSNDILK